AIITILVSAIGAYAYGGIVRSLVEERDRQLAIVSADRLSENMRNYAAILQAIASTSEIQSGVPTRQRGAFASAATQTDLLSTFDAGVFLLDENGVLVTSAPYQPDLVGLNFSSRAYFDYPKTRREPFFS